MSPFVFDTLSASKQLREAGMPEGVAEAVVNVFQNAAAMPDISHLATKADLEALTVATKADLEALSVATKTDVEGLRSEIATKADAAEMKAEFATLRAEFQKEIRQQGWLLLGGITALVTLVNVTLKVFA